MRILLCDDDPKLVSALDQDLRSQGHVVDSAGTCAEAEDLAAGDCYGLVVLDRMLPDGDGASTCRALRTMGLDTPVLILSGLGETDQRVLGLDAGADDYLSKPFELTEFHARVRALLRRRTSSEATVLRYADLSLDLIERRAQRGDAIYELTGKEFALLEFLMRSPDRVLTKAEIAEGVWDVRCESSSNVVEVYISALRKKIDRRHDPVLIHTVVGTGYRFGRRA